MSNNEVGMACAGWNRVIEVHSAEVGIGGEYECQNEVLKEKTIG